MKNKCKPQSIEERIGKETQTKEELLLSIVSSYVMVLFLTRIFLDIQQNVPRIILGILDKK